MAKNKKIFFPKGTLTAEIQLPASKSILNRALIIASLAETECKISYRGVCDDTSALINALNNQSDYINVGAAGTAMRFLAGKFASQPNKCITLDGCERMRERPIRILVDALRSCGARIEYIANTGYPPIKIRGSVLSAPDYFCIDAGVSSQYISSLLMIAPYMRSGMNLHIDGECKSLPYIDMTINMMNVFGVRAERNGSNIRVLPGKYQGMNYVVEADWSAASYWYEIAALRPGSKFTLRGLRSDSIQGDRQVAEIFRRLGVTSTYHSDCVEIESTGNYAPEISLDLNNYPDLAQTVAVTSAMLGIPFKISGLSTLRIKETDRITALQTELSKIGIKINVVGDDCISYDGRSRYKNADVEFSTYNDHRMAMSLAPVSLMITNGAVVIENADVVSKSYPDFWNDVAIIRQRK